MSLSVKQQKVLDFIRAYDQEHGYPPSVRDICAGLSLKSTSTAHGYLERLEKKGLIRRDPSKNRAIELADKNKEPISRYNSTLIPVIGRVAAGTPILAEQNIEEYIELPADYFSIQTGENFILEIKGQSMVNAGILNGDHIVVRRTPTAENGEIVVALIDEEATCKRYYKENGHFRLQPENDLMDPIIVDHVIVLGKVVGLIRQY